MSAVLAALLLVMAQGEARQFELPHQAGLRSATLIWQQHEIPMSRRGNAWRAVIGADLDREPGDYPLAVQLDYSGDVPSRQERHTVRVASRAYPTTELTVEQKYVELSAPDQARAARERTEIGQIYATVTPQAYWRDAFQSPLPGVSGGRNFGHRRVFNGQPRSPHSGADLAAGTGTEVMVSNAGRVVLARDLFFSGNAVFVDHGQGVHTVYLHLSEINVAVGDSVAKGQVIGRVGATGRVTGPHLHWGARVLDARVDPFSLLELENADE